MYGEPDENAADETAAGFVVGTANFVAPEIVMGADYDGRADQYSLGITVYNTLIGAPPMLGKTPSATMVNQTRLVLPLISDVRKAVPVATAQALAKAISKKPQERFATCVDFAEAAIAGLSGSQATAPRPRATALRPQTTTPPATRPADSSAKSQADSTSVKRKRPVQTTRIPSSSGTLINTKRVSKAKMVGIIDCPQCRSELRLRPEHAGRSGRCIQCKARLRIGADLMTLTVLSETDASGSSNSSATGSSDDLIIGEKVFGVKLSRKTIMGLGISLLVIVVIAAVMFLLQLMKPDLEKQEQELQQRYQNREG